MKTHQPALCAGVLAVAVAASAGILLTPVSAQSRRVYFGNLHSHTKYSDGMDTPTNAFKKAREAGIDFLAITEHNHSKCETDDRIDGVLISKKPKLYEYLINAAIRASKPGKFVGLYGQEFSTTGSGNHLNVFEVGKVIDENEVPSGAFKVFYESWLPAHPDSMQTDPLIQMNHPDLSKDLRAPTGNPSEDNKLENDYGYDDYGKSFPALQQATAPYVRLIEVLSGPATSKNFAERLNEHNVHQSDYLGYLAHGFRLAPTGNQDNHYFNLMGSSSNARTGVWASELSRKAILTALRERRCFATEDKNLEVAFTLNDQPMGSVLRLDPGPIDLKIEIFDRDEVAAPYTVELFQGEASGVPAEVVDRRTGVGNGSVSFESFLFNGSPGFYLIKVTQRNGSKDRAWTAPIWLEPRIALNSIEAKFVWSRISSIYHHANCRVVALINPDNRESGDTTPVGKSLHRGCPR